MARFRERPEPQDQAEVLAVFKLEAHVRFAVEAMVGRSRELHRAHGAVHRAGGDPDQLLRAWLGERDPDAITDAELLDAVHYLRERAAIDDGLALVGLDEERRQRRRKD